MSKNSQTKGDVEWYLPGEKKPFAHSTKATSDLIVMLSYMCKTIGEVYQNINYDPDAKKIIEMYIACGYESENPENWFK